MKSKKYQAKVTTLDRSRAYTLTEAINLAKQTSYSSFDGSIDLHIRLVGRKPEDKQFRSQVALPHGVGKSQQVVILTEQLIDQIAGSGKAPADVYLATPALMPKVAKIAKVLGPKGKMPNPKSGTVTDTPAEQAKELSLGNSMEVRADATGNIHASLGKVSWETDKLQANAEAIVRLIPRSRIGSTTLSATMGPGITLAL